MKGRKNLLLVLVLFAFILFGATGCGNKTAVTQDKFIEVAKSHDLETLDAMSQFETVGTFKSAAIAYADDKSYQIEFYEMNSEDDAASLFQTNRALFEAQKGSTNTESEVTGKNYENYKLISSGYYMYICRVDNTMIYVHVEEDYKDAVVEIVEELGY